MESGNIFQWSNEHCAIEKDTDLINALPIFGPISKEVPRGNISPDSCSWHENKEVNIKSLSSLSLGSRYPTGRNQSRQRTRPLSRRKMNSGCLRSGSLEAQPEWCFCCKWLLEGRLSDEGWESRWAGEESGRRMGTLTQTGVSLVARSP